MNTRSKLLTALLLGGFALSAQAATTVIEGDKAKSEYNAKKANSMVLDQKKKTFFVEARGGKAERKPSEMKVKAGEPFFIKNSESKIVHNVYDDTDKTWVLTKQQPDDVAMVTFNEPGVHELKCAIHPRMKIKVIVE